MWFLVEAFSFCFSSLPYLGFLLSVIYIIVSLNRGNIYLWPPHKSEITVKWEITFTRWGGGGGSTRGSGSREVGPERDKAWLSTNRTGFRCDIRKHIPQALCCFDFSHTWHLLWNFKWHLKEDKRFWCLSKGKQGDIWHCCITFLSHLVYFRGIFFRYYLRLLEYFMVIWFK